MDGARLFNRTIVHFTALPITPKVVLKFIAGPYLAGEDLDDGVKRIAELNRGGFVATLDELGEEILHLDDAHTAAHSYRNMLATLEESGVNSNVSIKLTALGLKLDKERCGKLVREVLDEAVKREDPFVRIDMEDYTCTQDTLDLYEELRREGRDNVGVVIQSYMRRTHDDISRLIALQKELGGVSVRLCKGIYKEPPSVIFPQMERRNANFLKQLPRLLENGIYVGIASHDTENIITPSQKVIERVGATPKKDFEFQALLGVPIHKVLEELRDAGHRVRLYVPFGAQWQAYSQRRLRNNPDLAGYIMKDTFPNLLKRQTTWPSPVNGGVS